MNNRILEILDNVRYWDTCPEDYKKDIETFLEMNKQLSKIQTITVTLPPSDGKKEQDFFNSGTKEFIKFPCCDEQNKTTN